VGNFGDLIMSFLMSIGAALLFAIGGIFMNRSQGLSQMIPSLVMYGLFFGGASLQTLAINRAGGMALTYVLILGLEAVLVMLFGTVLLKEGYSTLKLAGIFLITIGVALLRSGDT
jgi:multidrug transporter EmrE-like cation transporter